MVTTFPYFFTIEKSILKLFVHEFFVCEPIFTFFAAHFMKNLVLNIAEKTFCLPLKKVKIKTETKTTVLGFNCYCFAFNLMLPGKQPCFNHEIHILKM